MDNNNDFTQELMELLVAQKSISSDEAQKIIAEFEKSPVEGFEDFLIDEGIVDEFDLLRALSSYFQVPSCDVIGLFIDTQLLRKFPKDFLLRNCLLPIDVDENIMIIVTARPNNDTLLSKIGKYVSYDIQFQVGITGDILDSIKEFYDESDTEDPDFDSETTDLHHEDIDEFIDEEIENIEEELRSE